MPLFGAPMRSYHHPFKAGIRTLHRNSLAIESLVEL
jgi:hypothetical protein